MSDHRTICAIWTVHAQRLPSDMLRGVAWTEDQARAQGRALVAARLCEGYKVTDVPLIEGCEAAGCKRSRL
jgi:hypothetical protein